MSLISEALKKAQRMRTDPMAGNSPSGEGGNVIRRGQPMPAKTLALIVAGIAGLMILVVITTIIVVRLNAPPPLTAAKSVAAQPATNMAPPTSSPLIAVAPVSALPTPEPATPVQTPPTRPPESSGPAVAPATVAKTPVVAPAKIPPATAVKGPTPAPATPPAALKADAPKADPRVQAYVDAVRVTGIRSSGTESKVLMNDRVFRLNDVVDRSLGIRLTEVRADSLTFVDETGFAYIKNF